MNKFLMVLFLVASSSVTAQIVTPTCSQVLKPHYILLDSAYTDIESRIVRNTTVATKEYRNKRSCEFALSALVAQTGIVGNDNVPHQQIARSGQCLPTLYCEIPSDFE